MASLHKQKKNLSDDQLKQEFDKRLKKGEQNDPEVKARVADALQNSKGKYVAAQVEKIRHEASDRNSDINKVGDNNNFKKNNQQFASQQVTAQIQQVEDLSEESKFENNELTQEIKVENKEHQQAAHSASPEAQLQPEPPEWTNVNKKDVKHQNEHASGHQATASWTHEAKHAPKPEAKSGQKQEVAMKPEPEPAPGSSLPNPTEIPGPKLNKKG